jgi:hypothetical protein
MPEPASARSPWLHGAASDLLLGCGGLFSIAFAAFALAGPERFAALPPAVPALLIYLVGMPHYGATLVRVYDHRSDRRAYALFSIAATLAIAALFLVGLREAWVASVLFTVYLTWSPWHYAAQNYGVAMMFARRRGVPLSPFAQRALRASFALSFGLVFVLLHLEGKPELASPRDVRLLPIGIPAGAGTLLFAGLLLLYTGSLAVFLVSALRAARARELAPSLAIVATQILWHSLPIAIAGFGIATTIVPLDRAQRTAFFTWIAAGHGVQYLWVTSYYARAASDWRGTWRYYAKALAAGTALWTLPALLLAPSRVGLPTLSGFFLLLAAVVNIHHFVLDGAIWKLRSARIARVLIRSDVRSEAEPRGGLRALVWSLAGAGALAAAVLFWTENVALPSAVREERARDAVRALDVLAWFERDDAGARLWAARRIEAGGDLDAALAQYRRSLALEPGVPVLTDLVRIYFTREDEGALEPVCQQLYAHLSAAERVAAATPAGACYRTAGRWRENRAEELASADPDARADASLQLGY